MYIIMYALFAVFQETTNNIVMLQCATFRIYPHYVVLKCLKKLMLINFNNQAGEHLNIEWMNPTSTPKIFSIGVPTELM